MVHGYVTGIQFIIMVYLHRNALTVKQNNKLFSSLANVDDASKKTVARLTKLCQQNYLLKQQLFKLKRISVTLKDVMECQWY